MSHQPDMGYTLKHAEKTAIQAISITDLQNINILGNNIIQHSAAFAYEYFSRYCCPSHGPFVNPDPVVQNILDPQD